MNLSSKVALITGGARGIGAEVAFRLARDGFKIVVNYVDHAQSAQDVVDRIRAGGGEAEAAQADVANREAVASLFDTARRAYGSVDVAVNCAGVLKLGRVDTVDDEMFDEMVSINLKGTFNVCREAAKSLRTGGRIVNFSSSVIAMRLPTYGIYIATKAAVEGLTLVLAQEMRGRAISVNAIAPGPVDTELFRRGKSPELMDHMAKASPLERLGNSEDIARVVSFLVGPEGGWINGQIIRANGGLC